MKKIAWTLLLATLLLFSGIPETIEIQGNWLREVKVFPEHMLLFPENLGRTFPVERGNPFYTKLTPELELTAPVLRFRFSSKLFEKRRFAVACIRVDNNIFFETQKEIEGRSRFQLPIDYIFFIKSSLLNRPLYLPLLPWQKAYEVDIHAPNIPEGEALNDSQIALLETTYGLHFSEPEKEVIRFIHSCYADPEVPIYRITGIMCLPFEGIILPEKNPAEGYSVTLSWDAQKGVKSFGAERRIIRKLNWNPSAAFISTVEIEGPGEEFTDNALGINLAPFFKELRAAGQYQYIINYIPFYIIYTHVFPSEHTFYLSSRINLELFHRIARKHLGNSYTVRVLGEKAEEQLRFSKDFRLREPLGEYYLPARMIRLNGGFLENTGDAVFPFLLADREVTENECLPFYREIRYRPVVEYREYGNPYLPVEGVSWNGAVEYCNWLSINEGYRPAYYFNPITEGYECDFSADGYRLPTDAEWNLAASADSTYPDSWNRENSEGRPHKAEEKPPREPGFYDLAGNLWEWCWDPAGVNNTPYPFLPDGTGREKRILAGGSYLESPRMVTLNSRSSASPKEYTKGYGFRLARSLPAAIKDCFLNPDTRPGAGEYTALAAEGKELFLAYNKEGIRLLYSPDQGASWQERLLPSESLPGAITMEQHQDSLFLLFTAPEALMLARSNDKGVTWHLRELAQDRGTEITAPALYLQGDSIYIAYISYFDSAEKPGALRLLVSHNGGTSWNITSMEEIFVPSLSFAPAGEKLLLCYSDLLSGKQIILKNVTAHEPEPPVELSATGLKEGLIFTKKDSLAVVYSTERGTRLVESTDNGKTWGLEKSLTPLPLTGIAVEVEKNRISITGYYEKTRDLILLEATDNIWKQKRISIDALGGRPALSVMNQESWISCNSAAGNGLKLFYCYEDCYKEPPLVLRP